jgi:Flp pilus assembly pilin Flp
MLRRFLQNRLKAAAAEEEPKRGRRRGATAMEYLVALTFILVVLILAVQHLGSITGGLLGNSAKATNITNGS